MLETAAGPQSAPRDRITAGGWRIVLLASLGGTLEFFDFVVFGIFARDIAEAIFPNTSPLVSLMSSFAAFAVGYLARPIGGIVLSHYGDRHGRRRVFLWSVFVMSLATFGMGLVPTHAQWGAAASALMVTLRIVQGFCLGGELPGALTYVVETPPRIAPFVCGVVFTCVTMGVAAATGVSLSLRTLLPPDLVPVLAWRFAFVLGGLGGILSFVLRRSLEESPEFARMRSLASRQPFRELLQTHARPVLVGCAVLAGTACFNGLFFSHLPAHLAGVLQYDPRQGVYSQTVGVIASAVGILATGWLGDRIPPRYLLRLGVALLVVLAYPFYAALEMRAANLTLLLTLAGLVAGLTNSASRLLTDLFPTAFVSRCRVGLQHQPTVQRTAPLVATTLIRYTSTARARPLYDDGRGLLCSWKLLDERYGGHVLVRDRQRSAAT
jgi:MFS family permease